MTKVLATEAKKVDSAGISAAMRVRYPLSDGYAMIEEVGNGTGAKCTRHADAVVMNLWPSRGLEIMGFEYKASRSDWLNELKQPGKADPVFRYCDKWYLVVGDASIVKDGELPLNWGLLVAKVSGDGEAATTTLRESVPATKLEPQSLDRSFVAAMLRAAAKESVSDDLIKQAKAGEYGRGYSEGEKRGRINAGREAQDFYKLKAQVDKFHEATGIYITTYSDGTELGKVVNIARSLVGGRGGWRTLEALLTRVDDAVKELKKGTGEIRKDVREHLESKMDPAILPVPEAQTEGAEAEA